MKKILLIVILVFGFSLSSKAQGVFKIGANFGLAMSDAADLADFSIGADAYYMFENVDALINFGPTIGFQNFFLDFIETDTAQFLFLGGAGRLKLLGFLNAGADAGYAVGISDYLDGGFYIRPVVGVDLFNTIELFVSYENIFDTNTWANLNAGILIEI